MNAAANWERHGSCCTSSCAQRMAGRVVGEPAVRWQFVAPVVVGCRKDDVVTQPVGFLTSSAKDVDHVRTTYEISVKKLRVLTYFDQLLGTITHTTFLPVLVDFEASEIANIFVDDTKRCLCRLSKVVFGSSLQPEKPCSSLSTYRPVVNSNHARLTTHLRDLGKLTMVTLLKQTKYKAMCK